MSDIFFEFSGLSANWNEEKPLFEGFSDRQSFDERHNMLPITGSNGSGKSTLMYLISTLKWPCEGTIKWSFPETGGHAAEAYEWGGDKLLPSKRLLSIRTRHFGFAFQKSALIPHLTVAGNLTYPLEVAGCSKKLVREKIQKLLDEILPSGEVGKTVRDKFNAFPRELSGGQQKRVALVQALVKEPTILFADEPTASLDENSAKEFMNVIKAWTRAGKGENAFIWVTHEKTDPRDYASHRFMDIKVDEDTEKRTLTCHNPPRLSIDTSGL